MTRFYDKNLLGIVETSMKTFSWNLHVLFPRQDLNYFTDGKNQVFLKKRADLKVSRAIERSIGRPMECLKICALLRCLIISGSDQRRWRMAGNSTNPGGSSASTNCGLSGRMEAPSSRPVWVSSEPSSDVVDELIRCFLEVVELPKDEI